LTLHGREGVGEGYGKIKRAAQRRGRGNLQIVLNITTREHYKRRGGGGTEGKKSLKKGVGGLRGEVGNVE